MIDIPTVCIISGLAGFITGIILDYFLYKNCICHGCGKQISIYEIRKNRNWCCNTCNKEIK